MREVKAVNQEERDRLRVLLDYWVKHNREHGDEFREWAETTRTSGDTTIHRELMVAAEEMDKVNVSLARALKALEGS
jgi:GrpB-like predicted nucleotidyltransferase (UPF0157 family)